MIFLRSAFEELSQDENISIRDNLFIDSEAIGRAIIIEEPEAHLYPTLQKEITELFLHVFNNSPNHFLLTTHSPYILAYLNVCLMRHQMKDMAPDLVDGKETLDIKDLAVYSFSSEKIESIVNLESGLINAERFDEATEKIDNEFDALLTRQYVLNNPEK